MTSYRCDRAPITNVEHLPDGRLRVKATFSRVGPLKYLKEDGTIQTEHLTADELFRADSLESAALAAVTLGHPPEGRVTPDNWKQYNVGASGSKVEVRADEGLVDIVYVIGEKEAIAAVESGDANQVSAGYITKVESRGDGKLYQTNRVYNHHALVSKGRAGASVRLHLDSVDTDADWAVQVADEENENTDAIPKEDSRMATYKGMEMSQDAITAFKKMETDMAAMKEDMKGMKQKSDAAEGELNTRLTAERDVLQGRVDELEADLKTRLDADQVEAKAGEMAQQKVDAYAVAKPFLKADAAFDATLTPLDWKRQAIAAARPSLKLDGKDPAYINAAFDMLTELGVSQQRGDQFQQTLETAQVSGHEGRSLNNDEAAIDEQIRKDHADATAAYTWKEAN